MFTFGKPTDDQLVALHAQHAAVEFSYPEVGATRTSPPAGYNVDHNRIRLGAGEDLFARARDAIRRFDMLRLGWLEPCWPAAEIKPGELVATAARVVPGLWTVNVCRIVYVVDEPLRFGFAYGTLAGHVERGEERFLVEQEQDGSVWFDILAFSRPGRLISWLGYPAVRWFQRRFARDSLAALVRAVSRP
jgi:uncharacterized protein (UPF0548 family)